MRTHPHQHRRGRKEQRPLGRRPRGAMRETGPQWNGRVGASGVWKTRAHILIRCMHDLGQSRNLFKPQLPHAHRDDRIYFPDLVRIM